MKDILICFSYGMISVVNNVSNKHLISGYELSPFFLLLAQEVLVSVIFAFRSRKFLFRTLNETLPLSFLFLGNLGLGLIGMKYVNLPMYVCIRKMTTIVIFVKNRLEGKNCGIGTMCGVFFITLGGLVAGFNDISSDVFGYCIVLGSVIMNALQLIYANDLSQRGLSSESIFFYSSLSVIPPALGLCIITEPNLLNSLSRSLQDHVDILYLLMGCISSALANFMIVLCSTQVSPIAASVTGNIKDVFSMLVGLVLFTDVNLNFTFSLGLSFSTFGAVVYTYSKLGENKIKG